MPKLPRRLPNYPAPAARKMRESLGLSIPEIVEHTGVGLSSVYDWEKRGAPSWYPYVLAGYAQAKAGLLDLNKFR